jgi:hypothetical protein
MCGLIRTLANLDTGNVDFDRSMNSLERLADRCLENFGNALARETELTTRGARLAVLAAPHSYEPHGCPIRNKSSLWRAVPQTSQVFEPS